MQGMVSVDPFARDSKLATFSNDLNPKTSAKCHMNAVEFLVSLKGKVTPDVVLIDPPYSPRQITECYAIAGIKCGTEDTQNARLMKQVRLAVRSMLKIGGVVLSFGWNSCGMGVGFEIMEILIVPHGGAHNDTICMAERSLRR